MFHTNPQIQVIKPADDKIRSINFRDNLELNFNVISISIKALLTFKICVAEYRSMTLTYKVALLINKTNNKILRFSVYFKILIKNLMLSKMQKCRTVMI